MKSIRLQNIKKNFPLTSILFFFVAPLILLGAFAAEHLLSITYSFNQFYLIYSLIFLFLSLISVIIFILINRDLNDNYFLIFGLLLIFSFSVLYRYSIQDISYNYATLLEYISKYPYFFVQISDNIQDYEKYSRTKAYIIGFTDFKKIERTKISIYFYSDNIEELSSGTIFLYSSEKLQKYSSINFIEEKQKISLSRIDSISKCKNGSLFNRLRIIIRENLYQKLIKYYDRWNAGSIYAVLTGSRQFVFQPLIDAFTDTGTSHLFALSGQHLSILLLILGIFTSNSFLLIIFSLLYLAFACWQVSFLRAFFSLVFAIIIKKYNIKPVFENLIAMLTLLVFVFEPTNILSISFLLSLSAIAAILYIYLIFPGFKKKILNLILLPLLFSFNISIFQFPLLLKAFGRVNILSPFINLVAIPLFCFAIYFIVASLFINPFYIFSNIGSGLFNLLSIFLLFVSKFKIFILRFKLSEFIGFIMFFLIYCFYFISIKFKNGNFNFQEENIYFPVKD